LYNLPDHRRRFLQSHSGNKPDRLQKNIHPGLNDMPAESTHTSLFAEWGNNIVLVRYDFQVATSIFQVRQASRQASELLPELFLRFTILFRKSCFNQVLSHGITKSAIRDCLCVTQ
jgi:hypothetical protein